MRAIQEKPIIFVRVIYLPPSKMLTLNFPTIRSGGGAILMINGPSSLQFIV